MAALKKTGKPRMIRVANFISELLQKTWRMESTPPNESPLALFNSFSKPKVRGI
jgi:hypothetical protein